MRKLIIIAATAILGAFALFAASPAATQEWVIRYIAEHGGGGGGGTNGVTTAWVSNYVESCGFKREEGRDYSTNTVQGIWNNIQLQIALARASTNDVQEVSE